VPSIHRAVRRNRGNPEKYGTLLRLCWISDERRCLRFITFRCYQRRKFLNTPTARVVFLYPVVRQNDPPLAKGLSFAKMLYGPSHEPRTLIMMMMSFIKLRDIVQGIGRKGAGPSLDFFLACTTTSEAAPRIAVSMRGHSD
jgi:hypothetical protein